MHVHTTKVSDSAGRPAGTLTVIRDVSELERLRAEHQAIFEATGDGMVVYTMDGTIVAANPAFCEMNGYACEELVGRNVALLVHPDKHELLRELIQTIAGGGALRARATNVRKDGSTFPVEVHGTLFEDESGPLILGVARDVTEQVEAVELLEQRVAERTSELFALLDVAHNVASVLKLEPLLNLILDQLKVAAEYEWATLLRFEGENDVLLAGAFGAKAASGPWVYPIETMGPSWAWERLFSGERIIVDDVEGEDPLARGYQEVMANHPEMVLPGAHS
ncbi:MAG: PAS domain S-box protein [Thermoleophilia bacterium]